ncbi:hypothetical protein CQ12_12610 [Bradyrhizobium jicamae]|uniref:Uncharacterized protein n=2 Tax=Bradyrhizobium jicamae TaxID=280332 RepID=A0A0R3KV18_9BRAD|nr:hypothetical protein CQ12_12610 [Bradyrhizobium jicamae]
MRIVIASILIWGSAVLAHAAELDLPNSKLITTSDPCRVKISAKPVAPLQISRRGAVYVIKHVHNACRLLASAGDEGSRSDSIRADLYDSIIGPIYRAHPNIALASQRQAIAKTFHATPRDIERIPAIRLNDEIARLQKDIAKLGGDRVDRSVDQSAATKALEPFIDAAAELSFASQVALDAYPDLFAKMLEAVPEQPRAAESDAAFRKGAPPQGSVRLSDAALALVQSFMREVRRIPGNEQVAHIGWTREQKSKRPGDREWSNSGAGWYLGAFRKTEVPPDVIDTVRGIEIIFTAEDPAAIAGKTFDATKRGLFVHD